MEKIKIGKIVNAVALRGEVKVYSYSDRKERFEALKEILVEQKKGFTPYEIQNVRYQKNIVILKLRGVDDRNAAEALKERDIYITEADLPELPDDTFYVRDLIGCEVRDEKNGSVIGKILRQKGWFYIVAGPKARGIDGPTEGTIPPYDHYVVLTPADPMGTSRRLAQALGHPVAIVDINDLGANILGCSQKEPSMALLARILGDNPLGQSSECTPMGIIRKV